MSALKMSMRAARRAAEIDANVYTAAEVGAIVDSVKPLQGFVGGHQQADVGYTQPMIVRQIILNVPSAGTVVVTYDSSVYEDMPMDIVRCSLTLGNTLDLDYDQVFESSGGAGGRYGTLAGTRGFTVPGAQNFAANLVCQHFGSTLGTTQVMDTAMTITFTPTAAAVPAP